MTFLSPVFGLAGFLLLPSPVPTPSFFGLSFLNPLISAKIRLQIKRDRAGGSELPGGWCRKTEESPTPFGGTKERRMEAMREGKEERKLKEG